MKSIPQDKVVVLPATKKPRISTEKQKISRAHNFAFQSKKKGRISEMKCALCGATENLHLHHEDYDKPREIVILCAKCHLGYHAVLKQSLNVVFTDIVAIVESALELGLSSAATNREERMVSHLKKGFKKAISATAKTFKIQFQNSARSNE